MALVVFLAAAGCNPPPAAESSDPSGATTSTTAPTGDTFVPTTTINVSSASTAASTDTGTGTPCEDGAAQCTTPDDRQVCEDGAWVAAPCPEGQGCDAADGTCDTCSCTPGTTQGCIDAGNIDTCVCFDFVPQPCPPDTACAEVDGGIACHKVVCEANEVGCETSEVTKKCNATGTEWLTEACPTTEMCDEGTGTCKDACTVVEKNESSLGCDFWAVDMPNVPPRDDFVFAVALSNPSSKAAAHVQIFDRNDNGNQQMIASGTIDPRDVEIFPLSGESNGDQGFYASDAGFLGTGIARGRAFHITSDIPIVATQFNPLGGANAFTTDASLLLPTHTLSNSYYHLAWDKGSGAGSTLIVIATEDNTVVTITSTVTTLGGQNGMPPLIAGVPTALPALKRHDYIQLSTPGEDLSATKITANAEVAVFGGHSCGHVPSLDIGNCDHLEEQIFPINTWGEHYIAARAPKRADEPMIWRVIAAKDGTVVSFEPGVSLGDMYALDAGELVQFSAEDDFEINTNSDHPVLVAGYMYGCEAAQVGPSCPGDPSMVLVVPVEQWVRDYVFLVDFSYTNDSVKLVRAAGQTVSLDCLGAPVTDWTSITPAYESATVAFNAGECTPGTNIATGSAPFGIMVVGEAESTSYAYPGGLQLKPINPQ